ncbi:GGDEF domain-containing protein [Merismopedia glauca]|uniref:GGDEF domain-containing protein n=1 Tax=Merismopedia glauca CCAP 1448/3 TaxID=1296344 RepID=A0A2T1C4H9_9CYAN|nr:GGDEF domain-containing protein [Merismopedia glauca]PSB03166.1 hypothetical protein C7B64_09805 [Merismopedia glauca CCAP 1448/3]
MTDKLQLLGRIDSLTGIYNRLFWEEQLPLELKRSQDSKKPVSIVLIEIDDSLHTWEAQGDDLFLRQVSQTWKQHLRRIDWLVRYQGREFGLILPGCETENAVKLTERLRTAFSEHQSQTFSAGVATWNTQENCEKLVQRAHQALYQAKQTGKNQTVIAF